MKKGIVAAAFIVGVILTVFVYQAVTIFQMRKQIANDHTTLIQVVDFLNQNIQAQQKATTGGNTQSASTPAPAPAPAKK
jgi:Tfp pilus assembly protein PilE